MKNKGIYILAAILLVVSVWAVWRLNSEIKLDKEADKMKETF